MATFLEKVAEISILKLIAGWVVVVGLGAAGWYFVYYSDALLALEEAEKSLKSAKNERQKMEAKLANFEIEMEKAAQAQGEIDQSMEVLPQTEASVDHMMRTFQQHGRLVGLTFEKWTPGAETKSEFYAKSTIAVEASGTWNQLGEFFRKLSELRKIVSIEKLEVALKSGRGKTEGSAVSLLSIEFAASTYRFLSEEERVRGAGDVSKASRRRIK